jgi:hypothetical protein
MPRNPRASRREFHSLGPQFDIILAFQPVSLTLPASRLGFPATATKRPVFKKFHSGLDRFERVP